MSDQDWEVDQRAGGGSGDHSGGAREAAPAEAGSRSTNVVPFPGNWFGSLEDLVPLDREPERVSARALTSAAEPPATPAQDASAFWEGEPAPLGDAVSALSDRGSPPESDPTARFAVEPEADGGAGRRRWLPAIYGALAIAAVAVGALFVVRALPIRNSPPAGNLGLAAAQKGQTREIGRAHV